MIAFETMAMDLRDAWRRYKDLFGEDPHGTPQQIRAMLALTRAYGVEGQKAIVADPSPPSQGEVKAMRCTHLVHGRSCRRQALWIIRAFELRNCTFHKNRSPQLRWVKL